MPSYPPNPQFQIVTNYSGSSYTFTNNEFLSGQIVRRENGFDTATVVCSDYQSMNFLNKVDADEDITVKLKDASEASWTTVFDGVVRFVELPLNVESGETLILKCDGAGYGFATTVCGEEYGVDSTNPTLDHIAEIIEDASNGIVPKWVEEILAGGSSSGHSYSTVVDAGSTTFNYVYFPYKPCNKCLNDLIDLEQGGRGASAGLHWIVTTDDKLLLSEIQSHSAGVISEGWTDYYGGSQANATLVQGQDFLQHSFQKLGREANYVLYEGAFRRPANGDKWTENTSGSWGDNIQGATTPNRTCTVSDESGAGLHIVDSYSIEGYGDTNDYQFDFYYPSSNDANMDFTKIGGKHNIPTISFFIQVDSNIDLTNPLRIRMGHTTTNGAIAFECFYVKLEDEVANADEWYHFTYPVGPYWKTAAKGFIGWLEQNSPSWSNIDVIDFLADSKSASRGKVYIDGLELNGTLLRGAYESGIGASNPLKMKVVTDDVGKDDTLVASDDSGTIAQLAYAELLRCKWTGYVGFVVTPLIKDLLPGQLLHIHSKKDSSGSYSIDTDMRATKIIHSFNTNQGYTTKTELSEDVTNGRSRLSFTDLNKLLSAARPEYQDRQASSIKARQIDITQTILEKSY